MQLSFVSVLFVLSLLGFADCFVYSRPYYYPRQVATVRVSAVTETIDLESNLKHVADCVNKAAPIITIELDRRGYAIIDDFLGEKYANIYRKESEECYRRGDMVLSQSSRWDSSSSSVLVYDKKNVLSTQLNGGDQYDTSPRLHEYIVALIQSIVPIINEKFENAKLNPHLATNKLAVCLGDGSCYDKHFDNGGGDDLRKLTVLLYLNPSWREELGGQFRMYLPDDYEETEKEDDQDESCIQRDADGYYYRDIEPRHNRLLVFWSDRLVHSVQEARVVISPDDHRYAMTVWILTSDAGAIINDDKEIKRHFNL